MTIKDAVYVRASYFEALFSTPTGAKVLEILKKEFDIDEIFNTDINITNYNLGRRDVVVYINQMIGYSEKERNERNKRNKNENKNK